MFDFVSYANDAGVQITIKPGNGKDLCTLEIIDKTGHKESELVTQKEIRQAENIDRLLGRILDRMSARIGKKEQSNTAQNRNQNSYVIEKLFSNTYDRSQGS